MESILSPSMRRSMLIVSCILFILGNCGGPLILRLYFLHGGNRVWLSSFLGNAGFIFTLIPLLIAYFLRRPTKSKFLHLKLRVFVAAAVIGLLVGLASYLYAYGLGRLPVSTSSLLTASQLVFTAAFALILVKQKFTSFSVNAVVLLTMGTGMLAMHTSSDRPEGESKKEYIIGFMMTIAAAVLQGFTLPLIELTYMKSKQSITFTVFLEFQMIIGIFASIFSFVGMIVNNDLKVIPREAREFGLGETRYCLVLGFSVVIWQCLALGSLGVICCGSSLLAGILTAVLLPVTEVLAVIFYQEKFQAEKGVALFLSIWGFVSYFYGEFQNNVDAPEIELPPVVAD